MTIQIDKETPTNGDVFKALFPEIETDEFYMTVKASTKVGGRGRLHYYFWLEWWNAPYKGDKCES